MKPDPATQDSAPSSSSCGNIMAGLRVPGWGPSYLGREGTHRVQKPHSSRSKFRNQNNSAPEPRQRGENSNNAERGRNADPTATV